MQLASVKRFKSDLNVPSVGQTLANPHWVFSLAGSYHNSAYQVVLCTVTLNMFVYGTLG